MEGLLRLVCAVLVFQSGLASAAGLPKLTPEERETLKRIVAGREKGRTDAAAADERLSDLSGEVGNLRGEVDFSQKSLELLETLKKKMADKAAEWAPDFEMRPSILQTQMASGENRVAPREANTLPQLAANLAGVESVIDRSLQASETVAALKSGDSFSMQTNRTIAGQKPDDKDPGKVNIKAANRPDEIRKVLINELLMDVTIGSATTLAGYIVPTPTPSPEPKKAAPPVDDSAAIAEIPGAPHKPGENPAPPVVADSPPEKEPFKKAAEEVKKFVTELKAETLKGLDDLQKERDAAGQGGPQASNGGEGNPGGTGGGGEGQPEPSPSESPQANSGGGGSGGGSGGGGGGDGKGGGGSAGGTKVPVDSIVGMGVNGGPIPQNDGSFRGGGLGSALSAGIKAVIDKAQQFAGKFIPQKAPESPHPAKKTSADRQLASLGISKGGAGGGGAGGGGTFDPAVNGAGAPNALGGIGGRGADGGGGFPNVNGAEYDGSNGKPNSEIEVGYQSGGSVDGGGAGDIGIKSPKEGEALVAGGTVRNLPTREVSTTKGEPGGIFRKMQDSLVKWKKGNKLAPGKSETTA